MRLWSCPSLNIFTLIGQNSVLEVYIRETCCLIPGFRASSVRSSLLDVKKNTPRDWFSFPRPWLYHTSPNPYFSTLPAQNDLPLSAKLWEFRYAMYGSWSWFSLRSWSHYVMLRIRDLRTSGYLPLSPYTMILKVLLLKFKNLLIANKCTFSTMSTQPLSRIYEAYNSAGWIWVSKILMNILQSVQSIFLSAFKAALTFLLAFGIKSATAWVVPSLVVNVKSRYLYEFTTTSASSYVHLSCRDNGRPFLNTLILVFARLASRQIVILFLYKERRHCFK